MDALAEAIRNLVDESANKVAEIVKQEHPLILAQLAKEIFDSNGQSHGRSWEPNSSATVNGFTGVSKNGKRFKVKGKGFNRRNYETGDLMGALTTPGFLEDEDYMTKLPSPKRGSSYGYQAANDFNLPQNRFDDIGQTPEDQEWIERQLEQKILEGFSGG